MKTFLVTTSWDDGSIYDLRLAELLEKYKLPATFYVPIRNPEGKVIRGKDIKNLGKVFEIGGHTENHKVLTNISLTEAKKEIVNGKRKLEDIIGREVTSFCYPKGKYNQEVKQLVGFSGFSYARTTKLLGTKASDKLLAPTTVHAYQHNSLLYFKYLKPEFAFISWDKLAILLFERTLETGGIFHLWGHSWEIDAMGEWEKLERVFQYIGKHTKRQNLKTNGELLTDFEKSKLSYYKGLKPENYKSNLNDLKNLVKKFDRKDLNVLDIGCGTGACSELFEKANYTGVDFAENFIKFSGKKYRGRKFFFADYKNIMKLGLPKQDLIIIWGMFEDVTNPFGQLEFIKDLIKKGTRIIFSLHNNQNISFRLSKAIQAKFSDDFPYTSFSKEFIESLFGVKVYDFGKTIAVVIDK